MMLGLKLHAVIQRFLSFLVLIFDDLIGIWLSKAKNAPFLILDVEGTDGRERGENQVPRLV